MSPEKLQPNASKIKSKINTVKKLSSQHKYREFWASCNQIVEMFRTSKLSKKDREKLWSEYSDICKAAKHRIQSKSGESKLNAEVIKFELIELKNCEGGKFWPRAKKIGELFKLLPLLREDRIRLWADYDGICKQVKAKQESRENGIADARNGSINLYKYATDSEYRTMFDNEEMRILCPNLYDLRDLSWYHKMADDRKAEHELDKTERRAEDERKVLEKIRKKREKQIRKVLGNDLVGKIKRLLTKSKTDLEKLK